MRAGELNERIAIECLFRSCLLRVLKRSANQLTKGGSYLGPGAGINTRRAWKPLRPGGAVSIAKANTCIPAVAPGRWLSCLCASILSQMFIVLAR